MNTFQMHHVKDLMVGQLLTALNELIMLTLLARAGHTLDSFNLHLRPNFTTLGYQVCDLIWGLVLTNL